jgi:hypothetical protein
VHARTSSPLLHGRVFPVRALQRPAPSISNINPQAVWSARQCETWWCSGFTAQNIRFVQVTVQECMPNMCYPVWHPQADMQAFVDSEVGRITQQLREQLMADIFSMPECGVRISPCFCRLCLNINIPHVLHDTAAGTCGRVQIILWQAHFS